MLSIVIAPILLPAKYIVDLPLIPPLDRDTLTSLTLFLLLKVKKQKIPILKPSVWNRFLIAFLVTIAISTILNFDNVVSGGRYLHGSGVFDVFVNPIVFLLSFMPFFLGRTFFDNPNDTEAIFRVLVMLALIYTLPMLWELRLSPQLHLNVFGYFPGDFIQQVRADGFRPVVFVGHGLTLAFWFSTCTIACLALFKAKVKSFGLVKVAYLIVILVLCKTASALIFLVFAIVLLFFLKPKKQIMLSLLAASMVMVYPFNATSQFVKNEDMLNYVGNYSADRRQSMETRFTNEHRLVEKALERPFFGWSGWGRNRVYKGGRDITISDGKWVITLGLYGGVGFVFYYIMLIYPIILALKTYQYQSDEQQQVYLVALVIILTTVIFNSVPNTAMTPIHLLLAGALLGQCEYIRNKQKKITLEKRRLN